MGFVPGRRRLLHGAAAIRLVHGLPPLDVGADDDGREALVRAANGVLASLDADQRRPGGARIPWEAF